MTGPAPHANGKPDPKSFTKPVAINFVEQVVVSLLLSSLLPERGHTDSVHLVDGVIHDCVSNIPAAVSLAQSSVRFFKSEITAAASSDQRPADAPPFP